MKRFSQRQGYVEARTAIQVDSIDAALRNKLWNAFDVHILKQEHPGSRTQECRSYFVPSEIWNDFFKSPIDQIGLYWGAVIEQLRIYFFNAQWYEIYDFIEFIGDITDAYAFGDDFVAACNTALEQELSGFRFIKGAIAPITSKTEIAAVEQAIDHSPSKAAAEHLNRALELLAHKPKPDFRNSIKESISAVEAACISIEKRDKAILSDALKSLSKKMAIHPALEKAFISMYGYTSDAKGIRHAMIDEVQDLSTEDAQYMLIACSAFVNYLFVKANKAKLLDRA